MPAPAPLLVVPPLAPTKTRAPVSAANVTLFRPSTFFIIAQTQLGLQLDIQLVPTMQVFVRLAPQNRGQSCGKRVTARQPGPPPAAGRSGASPCPLPQACAGTSTRTRPMTSGPSAAWWRARPLPSPTPGRPRPPAPTSRTASRTPAPSAWRTVCVQQPRGPPGASDRSHPVLLLTEELGAKESRSPRGGSRLTCRPAPLTTPPLSTEKYAQHWCSRLTDPHGPFAQCHSAVDPSTYYSVMPPPGSVLGPGPPSASRARATASGPSRAPGLCPLPHSPTPPLSHSLIHSFTHSFIHSLTHFLIHSFTHSFIHSLIHSANIY